MRRRPAMLVTCALIAACLLAILIPIPTAAPTPLGPPRHPPIAPAAHPPALPPVGDFATVIDTTPDNPFMYNGRPIVEPQPAPPGDDGRGRDRDRDPRDADLPTHRRPALILPRAADLRADAPVCHGYLTIGNMRFALVTTPAHPDLRQMAVGDTISTGVNAEAKPWTLIGLDAGNLARWRSPSGDEEVLPIADGVHASIADTAHPPRPGPAVE